MIVQLILPDLKRCQMEWRIHRPSAMGGAFLEPIRCKKSPVWIAEAKEKNEDGVKESKSFCDEHRKILEKLRGKNFCNFVRIRKKE